MGIKLSTVNIQDQSLLVQRERVDHTHVICLFYIIKSCVQTLCEFVGYTL